MSLFMLPSNIKVYVATFRVDMRKSFHGLCTLISQEFKMNSLTGDLFVFCNKRGDKIKILYWDRTGFSIWYKQLEKGTFEWPRVIDNHCVLTMHELSLLVEGISFTVPKHKPYAVPHESIEQRFTSSLSG